jgi:hypothetical protein
VPPVADVIPPAADVIPPLAVAASSLLVPPAATPPLLVVEPPVLEPPFARVSGHGAGRPSLHAVARISRVADRLEQRVRGLTFTSLDPRPKADNSVFSGRTALRSNE